MRSRLVQTLVLLALGAVVLAPAPLRSQDQAPPSWAQAPPAPVFRVF